MNVKLLRTHSAACTARKHHPANPWAEPFLEERRDEKGRQCRIGQVGELWQVYGCKHAFCQARVAVRVAWIGERIQAELEAQKC